MTDRKMSTLTEEAPAMWKRAGRSRVGAGPDQAWRGSATAANQSHRGHEVSNEAHSVLEAAALAVANSPSTSRQERSDIEVLAAFLGRSRRPASRAAAELLRDTLAATDETSRIFAARQFVRKLETISEEPTAERSRERR
jgi:hypothetical protein